MKPRQHAISLIRAMTARVEEKGEEAQQRADDAEEKNQDSLQMEADAIHDAVAELEQIVEGLESYD